MLISRAWGISSYSGFPGQQPLIINDLIVKYSNLDPRDSLSIINSVHNLAGTALDFLIGPDFAKSILKFENGYVLPTVIREHSVVVCKSAWDPLSILSLIFFPASFSYKLIFLIMFQTFSELLIACVLDTP